MRIRDGIKKANTGLDAIKRAPILEYDTGLRCIRIQDISQNKHFDEWGYTETSLNDRNKFLLKKDDILIARTGATVGVSIYIDKDMEAVFNNGTIRLKTNDKLEAKYLYYVFQTKEFRQYVDNISCVATQPNMRIEGLLKFTVPDIGISNQRNISRILAVYDELINNNKKRTDALEQIANNLYKEWFVRFRFPGYENYEFEEKQPRGWIVDNKDKYYAPRLFKYAELKSIGEFTRGKNITSSEMVEGDIPVISAGLEPSGYHNKANVFGISLTISASGANAGYLKYNQNDIWAADCSYYQNDNNIWFVYNTLKYLQPVISNMQCGAAQPHVYPKHINKLYILIPTDELILEYNNLVSDVYNEISYLRKKTNNLRKQRDLLLPRLMSGKLEVK